MFENLGVWKGSGDILGQIYLGPDTLGISKIGRYYGVLLNNRIIMMAKSQVGFSKRVVPVISHIIKHFGKESQLDSAQWRPLDKRYTEMIMDTIKNISKDTGPIKIYLLEAEPDETQDNRSILSDKHELLDNLNNLQTGLKRFKKTKNNIQEASEVLLRTDLDKGLWGSKKVMNVINTVKSDIGKLSLDYELVDGSIERFEEQLGKLNIILSKKIAFDQIKDTIGKITENFALLKSFLSELVQVLYRFYKIGDVFKSYTGYPATWFLNGSIFMDFIFEYDNLIGHLIKFAALESNVIEPLLVWKIKLTGE